MNAPVNFAGVLVDNVTISEAAAAVEGFLSEPSAHLIATPNPEMIVAAQNDPQLKEIINRAHLRIPDGISMVVVSRILGNPLKERVAGIDLMFKLVELSAKKGFKIFLLGGAAGVAKGAADNLMLRYPDLQIIGTYHGFFSDDQEVLNKINSTRPDILFAGLGAVRQEKWLAKHLDHLNVRVAMGVGGSFDVIAGQVKRAPAWAQKLYIEWLYRLISQPWRWRRQMALPKFLRLMFRPKI